MPTPRYPPFKAEAPDVGAAGATELVGAEVPELEEEEGSGVALPVVVDADPGVVAVPVAEKISDINRGKDAESTSIGYAEAEAEDTDDTR